MFIVVLSKGLTTECRSEHLPVFHNPPAILCEIHEYIHLQNNGKNSLVQKKQTSILTIKLTIQAQWHTIWLWARRTTVKVQVGEMFLENKNKCLFYFIWCLKTCFLTWTYFWDMFMLILYGPHFTPWVITMHRFPLISAKLCQWTWGVTQSQYISIDKKHDIAKAFFYVN